MSNTTDSKINSKKPSPRHLKGPRSHSPEECDNLLHWWLTWLEIKLKAVGWAVLVVICKVLLFIIEGVQKILKWVQKVVHHPKVRSAGKFCLHLLGDCVLILICTVFLYCGLEKYGVFEKIVSRIDSQWHPSISEEISNEFFSSHSHPNSFLIFQPNPEYTNPIFADKTPVNDDEVGEEHIFVPPANWKDPSKNEPTKNIRFHLTTNERYTVESMVAGEAGNQSLDGMKLVAQCIYNGMVRSNYTPEQVRINYQYSGWKDINTFYASSNAAGQRVKDAVSQIFDDEDFVVNDNILWFCNTKSMNPNGFHAKQRLVIREGAHSFFAPW